MANSELYGKTFRIPEKIIKQINSAIIKHPNFEGIKRAKFIIKNGVLTYQALKRIKNFFDGFNQESDSHEKYELAGGDLMKNFIERTLNTNRNSIERSKEIKSTFKGDLNLGIKAQKPTKLNESFSNPNRNAVIIIVNLENKILLLKRGSKTNWEKNKWALVGGSIESGETVVDACKREAKEETDIDVEEIINVFNIMRNGGNNFEYVFACRYYGPNDDVKINGEHSDWGWFSLDEIKKINDKVLNLNEYLSLAFKNYDS